MTELMPFTLVRDEDVSGVSGVGVVADGVLWPDGSASVRWRGEHPSVVHWQRGLVSVKHVHGHGGATRIVLASDAGRLSRIANAHVVESLEGGLTSGLCVECGHLWPCPTRVWAENADRDLNACWDPADDERQETRYDA